MISFSCQFNKKNYEQTVAQSITTTRLLIKLTISWLFMKLKKLSIITIIIIVSAMHFCFAQNAYTSLEVPLCCAAANHGNQIDHEVHTYSGFSLCYRESYEVAEWVCYTLTKEKLVKVTNRLNNFRPDTLITTGSAELSDYKRSGYDRGHLAPSADMAWSIESNSDSFLLSNITPQIHAFNSGKWKELEEQVRAYAKFFDEIFIVTGPILEKPSSQFNSIGANKVCVPEYFYKVLLAKNSEGIYESIGFIMPNQKCEDELLSYVVSVNDVEKRTNLDFFSALDDKNEEEIESQIENTFSFLLRGKNEPLQNQEQ